MALRKSSKLAVPHPTEKDCAIAGVLEQLSPEVPVQGRKIALILHGTMGHKDYLFQKRLALRLPLDSFRFDFRGNHETPGTWRQGGFADDVEDLIAVVKYLTTLGYEIDLLVGHSRGSVVAFHWLCTSEEGKRCGGFVNVSGRYRIESMVSLFAFPSERSRPQQNTPLDGVEALKPDFESQGYHDWKVTVARKVVTGRIYPEDFATFAAWDSSIVWEDFPDAVDVLTLHGLEDKTVPPYDAVIYARALSNRNPGTHNIHLVENADHNFTGRQDEVVDTILEWWEMHQKGNLRTGIWMTGIRGRL